MPALPVGRRLYAAVDVGTSRVKLYLFDDGLGVVRRASVRAPLERRGYAAVHDAERLAAVVRGMLDRAVDWGASAVGLATYRGSVVVWRLDTGEPVTGVVTWMDRRGLCRWRSLPLAARLASRVPGVGAAFTPESPMVKLAVTLRESPGLRRGLEEGRLAAWNVDAYLAHRLLGRLASSADNAALTGLVDPRSLEPYWPVARILGLPRLRVPEIVGHDEPLGSWRGVPVGPLVADQQAAAHGLGALEPGVWKATLGTGFFLDAPTGGRLHFRAPRGLLPVILHHTPKATLYGLEAYAPGLGLVAEALVEGLAGGDYGLLDPARWTGDPLLAPYPWGLRTPTRIPGAWALAASEPPTPRDYAAALAASLAATLKMLHDAIEGRLGRPREVRVGGGLSRARPILAAYAAAARVEVKASPEGPADTAAGAARLAAVAAGHPDPGAPEPEPVPPAEGVGLPEPGRLVELARRAGGAADPCMQRLQPY